MNTDRPSTVRTLRGVALLSFVQGVSSAAGTAVVAAALWWLQGR